MQPQEVVSVEKEWGQDLIADEPFAMHLKWAKEDAYHSGFPCGTFSRLRFRKAPGMLGPVRSREELYGIWSNSAKQQEECDLGTIMMSRSCAVAEEWLLSRLSSMFHGQPPEDSAKPWILNVLFAPKVACSCPVLPPRSCHCVRQRFVRLSHAGYPSCEVLPWTSCSSRLSCGSFV